MEPLAVCRRCPTKLVSVAEYMFSLGLIHPRTRNAEILQWKSLYQTIQRWKQQINSWQWLINATSLSFKIGIHTLLIIPNKESLVLAIDFLDLSPLVETFPEVSFPLWKSTSCLAMFVTLFKVWFPGLLCSFLTERKKKQNKNSNKQKHPKQKTTSPPPLKK